MDRKSHQGREGKSRTHHAALEEMIMHDGPVFFDCVVDDKENVYPMIPAGAAHNELLLSPDEEEPELDKNAV